MRPGIFALRYVGSSSEKPPRIFVEASPSSRDDIQVVFVPGRTKGVLDEPRHFALVVAERDGHLQLTVSPFAGGGASARVQLEPLKLSDDAAPDADRSDFGADPGSSPANELASPQIKQAQSRPGPERLLPIADEALLGAYGREAVLAGFALTCHVAKRGDVIAGPGDWVGGPGAPAVIEGVSIHLPRRDAEIEYQVLIQGSAGQWSPWVRAGRFAGTQGRRLGIVGLRVRLTDAAPEAARLTGEAAFLGCPLIKEEGRDLELTSYAGVDPLVGLRLQLEGAEATEGGVCDKQTTDAHSGRSALRVFKPKLSNAQFERFSA